jgi:hypothetical protein
MGHVAMGFVLLAKNARLKGCGAIAKAIESRLTLGRRYTEAPIKHNGEPLQNYMELRIGSS